MKLCRRIMQALLAVAVVALPSDVAVADGGRIVHVEKSQGLIVTLFAAPNPLQAGPIDFSVLVQKEASLQFVDDAEISVTCRRDGDVGKNDIDKNDLIIAAAATREQTTNKLLQSAIVDLPASGEWDVEVAVEFAGRTLDFQFPIVVDNATPASRWELALVVPLMGAVFLVLHRYLATRRPSVQRQRFS